MIQARADKKDPEAIKHPGDQYVQGKRGLEKDVSRSVELWTEAAELGSANACFSLGLHHHNNGNVTAQDIAKGVRFYEKAAMLGHSMARHNLGNHELYIRGNYDRAVRHFLISAKLGDEGSLEAIKKLFTRGSATKSQYAEALKGYQNAIEEMKSPDRAEAKKEDSLIN